MSEMPQLMRLLAIMLLIFFGPPSLALAESLTGRVVGVHDGDTLTLLLPGNIETKIRLNQIDAPELGQEFGQASKQALSDLVFNKAVKVDVVDTDKYGRTVGTVWIGGIDVNLTQVRNGMAWAYRKYLKDPAYLDAETQAKNSRLGLWSRPDPMPPWVFRHPEQRSSDSASGAETPHPDSLERGKRINWSCGSKHFCKEMTSCDEARYYLETCGVVALDKNRDGTPCESLCR